MPFHLFINVLEEDHWKSGIKGKNKTDTMEGNP